MYQIIQRVYSYCKHIADMILYLICPPFCTVCSEPLDERVAFCDNCYHNVQPCSSVNIAVGRYTIPVYAVGMYTGPLKKLILAKGYRDRVACYYMAQLIADHLSCLQTEIDYIIFVPSHWTRYAERGYNQSEEIACFLSKRMQVPYVALCSRIKKTAFQASCSKEERHANVHQAFALKQHRASVSDIHNKHILIVDDLFTTGATMRAVIKTLLPLKPIKISVAVVARA